MSVAKGLCPPHLLLCDRGVFCDLVHSHEEIDSGAVGSRVLAAPALTSSPLISLCVLSFYDSNKGGEEMTSSFSRDVSCSGV